MLKTLSLLGAGSGGGGGGNASITVTDGTNSVTNATLLTFSNSTVSGTSPNAVIATHNLSITDGNTTINNVTNINISGGKIKGNSVLVTISTGGFTTALMNANFAASANTRYLVDTFGGNVAATVEASPALFDMIAFADANGSFSTHPLTINWNGNNYQGSNANVSLSLTGEMLQVQWTNLAYGWIQIP